MTMTVKLPEFSFVTSVLNNETMMIIRGTRGFQPIGESLKGFTAEELNQKHGITPEQALSMEVGSLYGWDAPGADPMYHISNQSIGKIKGTIQELPDFSFVQSVLNNETMMIYRGEQGYYRIDASLRKVPAVELNQRFGITRAQDRAMQYGALYSWKKSSANPMHYVKSRRIQKKNKKTA